MKFIAEKLNHIAPSQTLVITTRAQELQRAGKNVIALSAGEPDFDTPENIKQAALEAMNQGRTKYTAVEGIVELKQAIIDKFWRENHIKAELGNIIITTGAKQAIYNLLMATLNPGDEVLILKPYWVSYPDITKLAGGIPVFVDTTEANFKLNANHIASHITSRTKWLILNSPNNPTGVVYTREELREVANLLLQHPNIGVLSDDIYEHIIYDREFVTLAQIEPKLMERIVTINGVSKAYSMTGWRIGYACGAKEIIKAMSILQSQSTTNSTTFCQYAAIEALNNSADFITEQKKTFHYRRDLIIKLLVEIKGFKCRVPEGAFYVFVNCKEMFNKKTPNGQVITNAKEFAEYLLTEALVALVPGEAFGVEGFIRFSFATSEQNIITACERIKIACQNLR